MQKIYLDNNATTKIESAVLEAMLPYLTEDYGNPGSPHSFGYKAKIAVEKSRTQIAKLLGITDDQRIIFTSGATEANNLALFGTIQKLPNWHIVTSSIEHSSVLEPIRQLEKHGAKVTYLSPARDGIITVDQIEKAITPQTRLCSIMAAQNEIGTLYPIADIAQLCRKQNIIFHTDATQLVGKQKLDIESLQIDLLTFSAHKLHGPKGIGALVIGKNASSPLLLSPLLFGGGQEKGLRSGTLNVPAIIGLAKALEMSCEKLELRSTEINKKRLILTQKLLSQIPMSFLNGPLHNRLYNNINITFPFAKAGDVIQKNSDLAFSTGSACASSITTPSHVLKEIGLTDFEANCTIRLGLSHWTTDAELDYTAERFIKTVNELRNNSLEYELFNQQGNHGSLSSTRNNHSSSSPFK